MPKNGMCGMLAGGATVPGRDFIDQLPLVEHMLLKSVLWQVARAEAMGAETPAATVRPASRSAAVCRIAMLSLTFPVERRMI
jgi:hypothetical protein